MNKKNEPSVFPSAILPSKQFLRDLIKIKHGRYGKNIEENLAKIIQLLASGQSLPKKYKDHGLIGKWKGCRDCHLHPDLVLIYRKRKTGEIELVRIGIHSELFE